MIYSIKTYDCGCKIQKRRQEPMLPNRYWIDYCPKHQAAPELYEALKTAISMLQAAGCTAVVLNPLEAVLAKVEGK